MADAVKVQTGMSLAAFMEAYDQQPFELINGEVVTLSPNVIGHEWIRRILYRLLDTFSLTHQLGEVLSEAPFVTAYEPSWVKGSRTPDILFLSAARWAEYLAAHPDWRDKPLMIVPDLVVEVISPTDRYTVVQTKVESYLSDGVQVVWIVDPERKRVTVHTTPQEAHTLGVEETLNGGTVLPGFSVEVKKLFE